MTPADQRRQQWQHNRAARLAAQSWLRTDTTDGPPARFVADELVVRDEHHATARDVLRQLGHTGRAVAEDDAIPGFHRVRVAGLDVARAVRAIRRLESTGAASPNHVFLSSPYEHGGPFGPPVPPAVAGQLPQGPVESASVRVAVVDTGVWRNSPLQAQWYDAGVDDYDDAEGADADIGHANFITGVVLGATRNARVRIVRVLDADGVCTEVNLANALLGLGDVDVVNLSLGGYTVDDQPPPLLATALSAVLTGTDRVLVAAAGNDGHGDRPFWPAAFTTAPVGWGGQVLAVAAHDGSDVCGWSNTGPWVSLAAPGSDITGMYVTYGDFTTGWARWSGTSFAAPYVVGALAERHQDAGTIVGAADRLRKDAAENSYSAYPGLA